MKNRPRTQAVALHSRTLRRCAPGGLAITALAIAFAAAIPGCTGPAPSPLNSTGIMISPPREPMPNQAVITADAYEDTYERARLVLRERGYLLDRQDYRFGVVTTQPIAVPNALEFWRPDPASGPLAMEATTNDLRRIVRVTLEPADPQDVSNARETDADQRLLNETSDAEPELIQADGDATQYTLRVEAFIERQQNTTRTVTFSTRRNVFTTLRDVPTHLSDRGISASYWLPLMRDSQTETRILQDILASP